MQRLENPKMSVVYCSAPNKQYLNNICDAIPLDNLSGISVPALPYITCGLIWDPKIRKEGIIKFSEQLFITRLLSGISKLRMGYQKLRRTDPECQNY